jgi:hypothetical protein
MMIRRLGPGERAMTPGELLTKASTNSTPAAAR